jgi:hypothetical protein
MSASEAILRWIAALLSLTVAFWAATGLLGIAAAMLHVSGSTWWLCALLGTSIGIGVASAVGVVVAPPRQWRVALPLFIGILFLWNAPSAFVFGGGIMVAGVLIGALLSYGCVLWGLGRYLKSRCHKENHAKHMIERNF